MDRITELIGCSPDAFADSLWHARPEWVKEGSLGFYDTRYLLQSVLKYPSKIAVEIGTATGFSTAVLCHALNFAHRAGLIPSDYRVVTYDISRRYYADLSKEVGAAAR